MAKSCRRCDMGNITLDIMTKKDRECVHSLIRFKERYRAYKNEQKGREEEKAGESLT